MKNPSSLERKPSTINGYGLFSNIGYKRGDIICGYGDKFVSYEEYDSFKDDPIYYYGLDNGNDGMWLPNDLEKVGGHIANHSCNPNSSFAKLYDKFVVKAIKQIKAGAEITVSYGSYHDDIDCKCSDMFCTGKISFYTKLPTSKVVVANHGSYVAVDDAKKFIESYHKNNNILGLSEMMGQMILRSKYSEMVIDHATKFLVREIYGDDWSNYSAATWAAAIAKEIRKPENRYLLGFMQ